MKIYLLSVCCLLGTYVHAQQPDSLRARINYSFTHVDDTTKRGDPYTENMVTLLGNKASLYTSIDRINNGIEMKKKIEEQMKNAAPGMNSFTVGGSTKRLTSVDVFQFPAEQKMFLKQRIINEYLIEEKLPAIDWKLSSDTMTIAGLKCQKATAPFKGRQYTAWFCPDIPFQSGPWKLNGLPGLIIEAYDAKKEVVFKFDGFELVKNTTTRAPENQPTAAMGGGVVRTVIFGGGSDNADVLTNALIELPKKGLRTTQKEYEKLKEAMDKDPQGFINSAMAGQGVTMKVAPTVTSVQSQKKSDRVLNNPIELAP